MMGVRVNIAGALEQDALAAQEGVCWYPIHSPCWPNARTSEESHRPTVQVFQTEQQRRVGEPELPGALLSPVWRCHQHVPEISVEVSSVAEIVRRECTATVQSTVSKRHLCV